MTTGYHTCISFTSYEYTYVCVTYGLRVLVQIHNVFESNTLHCCISASSNDKSPDCSSSWRGHDTFSILRVTVHTRVVQRLWWLMKWWEVAPWPPHHLNSARRASTIRGFTVQPRVSRMHSSTVDQLAAIRVTPLMPSTYLKVAVHWCSLMRNANIKFTVHY